MKGSAGSRELCQTYVSYYQARSHEGNMSLCDKLDANAQLLLLPACDSAATPSYSSCVLRENLLRSSEQHRAAVLRRTARGLAILELICVNLFLYPWRKEIRTLKKFTGTFIYFVEPVISKDTIRQILQRVGYSIDTETEYIIGGCINIEEAKQAAFELYLSRIQCEELILLITENRTDSVNLFITGSSTEPRNERENIGLAVKSDCKIANILEIEGINNLNDDKNISENIKGNKDSEKPSEKFDLHASPKNSQDGKGETSAKHLNYSYNKYYDSDEFLNKYSDLNLAQQPIFPLHNRQINIKLKALREEPNFVKPHSPDSFTKESESDVSKGTELTADSLCGQKCRIVDARILADVQSNLDLKRPLILSESPVEFSMPNKQGPLERLVNKLKMGKVDEEALAFPVEETLPPDPIDFSNSSDMCQWKSKWTHHKSREIVDGTKSPPSTSGSSVLNITGKAAEGSACIENLHRLREPPSSTYIPPGVVERQCLRITDIQPEDNHFQAPCLSGDMDLVSETLYNMDEDTREDFVMITKKEHLQH
ncbi:uncharacterized protein LOC134969449 [Pseudophryne corroboree]|uniref:uncharacterized protein LOC134969449 n=1 Tax=Pseudophryne corroboree TaxID=495146 RepID=UPI0030814212